MSKIELLKDLHITIQCLKKELTGDDVERVEAAQEAYEELLNDFYEEYQDQLSPEQLKKAKNDPDYFLVLIQLAYHHQDQEIIDDKEG
jgi:hypothetical protein